MSMMYSRFEPPLLMLSLVDVGRPLAIDEPPAVSFSAPSLTLHPLLGRTSPGPPVLPPLPPLPMPSLPPVEELPPLALPPPAPPLEVALVVVVPVVVAVAPVVVAVAPVV